jgi:hypothetical protein
VLIELIDLWSQQAYQVGWIPEVCSRSHDAVIRVYDESGKMIETHEQKGDFTEP